MENNNKTEGFLKFVFHVRVFIFVNLFLNSELLNLNYKIQYSCKILSPDLKFLYKIRYKKKKNKKHDIIISATKIYSNVQVYYGTFCTWSLF